jgi:hypothetical protein
LIFFNISKVKPEMVCKTESKILDSKVSRTYLVFIRPKGRAWLSSNPSAMAWDDGGAGHIEIGDCDGMAQESDYRRRESVSL